MEFSFALIFSFLFKSRNLNKFCDKLISNRPPFLSFETRVQICNFQAPAFDRIKEESIYGSKRPKTQLLAERIFYVRSNDFLGG